MKTLLLKHKEVVLYLIFGGLTTVINWAVSVALYHFGAGVTASTIAAWVVSVLFAYAVNKIFVFESKNTAILLEMAGFFGARLFSGVVDLGIMKLGVDLLGFNFELTKLVSQVFVIVFNYFASKFFIFKKR
ncbi:membrane protein [Clostridia bacterium]|nr:membrane protein [Clostridia bacterium]